MRPAGNKSLAQVLETGDIIQHLMFLAQYTAQAFHRLAESNPLDGTCDVSRLLGSSWVRA